MARIALIVAAVAALIITALTGFVLIPWLHKLKYGQTIKEIGPTWHKGKQGTPTMGGIMFIFGSLIGIFTAYICMYKQVGEIVDQSAGGGMKNMFLAVLTALAFGLVGFIDDFIKVVKHRNLGLLARYKIIMQVLITTVFMLSLYLNGSISTVMNWPIIGRVDFGWFYYIFSFLLIIAMVNAVNLTDGIDGLAASVTFVASLGFVVIASMTNYFTIALFAVAVAGGCAGFLSWNFHPAKVFMGDTGSMFLGGAVVAMAYCIGKPEILFLVGIVYVCEAASDILQVCFFKLTHGKRIFKMAPIHHHFEMCGWSEEKIVAVFTAVGVLGTVLACIFVYING